VVNGNKLVEKSGKTGVQLMFSSILVPLDGTTLAEKALPHAVRLAKICNASLILLEAWRNTERAAESGRYLQTVKRLLVQKQYLEENMIEAVAAEGDPENTILEVAGDYKSDLIIMTTHSRTGLSRLMLGSVACKVLQTVNCPVILLHPNRQEETRNLEEILKDNIPAKPAKPRIAIALDGTPESEAALEPTLQLAETLKASVYLLQIVQPVAYNEFSGTWYLFDLDEQARIRREVAYEYLTKIQAKVVERGLDCIKVVRVGQPAPEIIEYLHNSNPLLLVMATHARGLVGQMVFGSVAGEVIRLGNLPVMMVHRPPEPDLYEHREESEPVTPYFM
jgi:nucleotide-binding universal stress UspA family protein